MKWGGVYRSGSKQGRAQQGGKYTETLTSVLLVPTARFWMCATSAVHVGTHVNVLFQVISPYKYVMSRGTRKFYFGTHFLLRWKGALINNSEDGNGKVILF